MKFDHRLFKLAAVITVFSTVVGGFTPLSTRGRSLIQTNHHAPLCAILHKGRNDSSKLFSTAENANEEKETEKGIPSMTLLSGFLGSGKTTTLQNLLTNNEGIKIGIVVNDVASVNIDSKLLNNPNSNNLVGGEGTVELQNGCACCSLADELLTSVEQLTDGGKRELDHIVIELSGVADPEAVVQNWKGAELMDHPATKLAKMDKVVTLVDSSTFGTDWMTWDSSGDREGWVEADDDCAVAKKVPELLSEQIEAADVLVLNKIDLAGEEQVKIASSMVKAMNEKAKVFEVNYGGISVRDVIGVPAVSVVEDDTVDCKDPDCDDSSHSHSHEHAVAHERSHDHDDSSSCDDPTCDDPTHDHSHSHDHDASCSDPTCNDPTHDHSHSHDHDASCDDPTCNDPTHDHSHSHDHATSADQLGISNFVYKRDRPFDSMRLLNVLYLWPVPVKEELDLELLAEAAKEGFSIKGKDEKSPFVGILRSKGFCWMAPTVWNGPAHDLWRHDTAMYWSHAGKHFGVTSAGNWWGTIPKDKMKSLFENNEKEFERILRDDFVTEEFGDRRQEIVFIGANISEDEITATLDECLCTDEEMEFYRTELANIGKPKAKKSSSPVKRFKAVSPPASFDNN